MNDCVSLREIPTACGRRFGHATLDSPKTLNALTLPMIDRLATALDAWLADPAIVGILLDGAGGKAFCAGGDVAALYRALEAAGGKPVPEAADFFEREYRLDYRIHTAAKPILCWGNGIVMGGGIGLLAGASHRVATPSTRMAMPEITIGLYPDVGGSWFLPRMPGHSGLFLALTGAALNAASARFARLADFVLADEAREQVLADLAATAWTGIAETDRTQLTRLLQARALPDDIAAAPLYRHFERIEQAVGATGGGLPDLAAIAPRLRQLADDADPWLAAAGRAFTHGAPSSAVLSAALWHQARHLSLAEVFRLEYRASIGATAQPDFAEGVRALLIDKDRQPRWQYTALEQVPQDYAEEVFRARFSGMHPLADLGGEKG